MEQIKAKTYQELLVQSTRFLEYNQINPLFAERLLMDRFEWSKTNLIAHLKEEVSEEVQLQYLRDLSEVIEGKPLQYVVGKEWFHGLPLRVTPATLIPRPETEELVAEALTHLNTTWGKESLSILDIGTGSGAIAIAMKHARPQDTVTAIDISKEALEVAIENAKTHGTEIRFLEGNLLEPVSLETFDCIISNPPYISYDEVSLMDESVLAYEPHTALFAENKGLSIYEQLAYSLPFHLKASGCVFMEIGFQQGEQLTALYRKAFPDKEVVIQKDLNKLDRMLFVR